MIFFELKKIIYNLQFTIYNIINVYNNPCLKNPRTCLKYYEFYINENYSAVLFPNLR